MGSYYQEANRNWVIDPGETPSLVRVDSAFDMAWNTGGGVAAAPPGMLADQFLVRWVGYLSVPTSGAYQFGVRSDDGVRIYLNGSSLVYDDWAAHGVQAATNWSAVSSSLTAGTPVRVEIDYYNYTGPGVLQVSIKDPAGTQQLLPAAWLSPGLSTMPAGWSVTLPGGGNSYTKAGVGYQSVVLTDSSGEGHTYLQTSTGGYTPPAGESGVLTGSSVSGWTLNEEDGSVYTFNSAGQPTSARSATDAVHPAAATYGYDTTVTPARINTIHDPVSNRDITLSYGGSADCPATTTPAVWAAAPANLLCKVSYWDGTATILHYTNGQLAAVEEPGTAITQFGYADGLLTQVRGVLANDLILAGKLADTPQTYTVIGYTWVQAATVAQEAATIRPPYVPVSKTNGVYPIGSVPLVTKVTGPAPDGITDANRSEHSYDYSVDLFTTKVNVKGVATTASTVTYDGTGRTLTTRTASNPATASTWDTASKDLPVTSTDPAGRMTTTVYDWADRATDSFGPAPAACFDTATGRPLTTPPGGVDCSNIPHSHTGYDTDMAGARVAGLGLDQFDNTDLTGQPSSRATANSLDPSVWAKTAPGTSSRLTGEIALAPATYTFSADLGDKTDDGIRVFVGDTLVVDRWWTLRQAVKADAPKAYWPLNSTAADAAVGTAANPPAWTNNSSTFTGGPVGPADATPTAVVPMSNMEMPNAFTQYQITSPTVELWFKTTSFPAVLMSADNRVGAGPVTSYMPILNINSSGQLQGGFWSPSGLAQIVSTGSVTDGQWHHVALSTAPAIANGAAYQRLYLDGTLVGSTTNPVGLDVATTLRLGTGFTTAWPGLPGGFVGFNGNLASVAIYDHPLDQAQAARHYQAGVASLTGTSQVSFAPAPAPVAGTLPTATVSTPQRVRVEYRNIHQAATPTSFTLKATTGGTTTAIPISAFSTRYGLATWQTTDDTGGVAGGKSTTATVYNGSGLDLQYGLATSSIADPAGIAVTTSTSYEPPSTTTYLRATGSALSSGSLSDPLKSTRTSYYGDTETRANPCVTGSPAVNQGGLAKLSTKPAAADGSQISEDSVYDAAGRVVAAKYGSDTDWTCTSYDARGRAATVTTPAWGSDTTARTVTTTYSQAGDARVSTLTDVSGTVSGTVDLLGRQVSYTDTSGVTTTSVYDVAGRTTSVTSVAGGVSSTMGYTYRDDGQVNTVTLDGATVATVAYDTNGEVSAVTYPFGSVGGFLKYPSGSLKGDTWSVSPSSRTFTEQVTRSQSGRVMGASWTDSSTAANTLSWGYSYDAVGRLTQAVLAGAGSRPQATFGYSFTKTGGCGADTAAGANGSRTGSTVQVGTNPVASSAYCYDYASRLTSVTGANAILGTAITYDAHGNATRIGDQTWTYDAADRVSGTKALSTNQALVYTRDMTGRVVARVATGPEAGTTRYGFSAGDDSPDFQLTAAKAISERYVSLPGGVLVTKPYNQPTASSSWSIPNWHGDITAQASISSTGVITVTGGNWVSDPFGQPMNASTGLVDLTGVPTTRAGTGTTDSWLGQHQRGYEHTGSLNQMLMGARTYLPSLGIFTSTDPVLGGNETQYSYPDDPENRSDLSGEFSWGNFLSNASTIAGFLPAAICGICGAVSAVLGVASAIAYLAEGDVYSAGVQLATTAMGLLVGGAAAKVGMVTAWKLGKVGAGISKVAGKVGLGSPVRAVARAGATAGKSKVGKYLLGGGVIGHLGNGEHKAMAYSLQVQVTALQWAGGKIPWSQRRR